MHPPILTTQGRLVQLTGAVSALMPVLMGIPKQQLGFAVQYVIMEPTVLVARRQARGHALRARTIALCRRNAVCMYQGWTVFIVCCA